MADQEGWERSDFPIVCETCLGDNPYVRMTREPAAMECKVCTRPFTIFRWRAGNNGRYKKTEICQMCAKLKNVCQTCLLDINFNLPVQVRDSVLPSVGVIENSNSKSLAHKEYYNKVNEHLLAQGQLPYAKAQFNPVLQTLARPTPNYDRNRAHICSFFVKGTCNRGDTCPFRHEMPDPDQPLDLAKQNMKDRYYGVNDPVAKRMLAQVKTDSTPPQDESIRTLFISNLDPRISEQDLRDHFYYFGEIDKINVVPAQRCAFIDFTTRDAAVTAMEKNSRLIIKGVFLKIAWARPTNQSQNGPAASTPASAPPVGVSGSTSSYYPSMNPERLGSAPPMIQQEHHYVAPPPGIHPNMAPNWSSPTTVSPAPPVAHPQQPYHPNPQPQFTPTPQAPSPLAQTQKQSVSSDRRSPADGEPPQKKMKSD